MECKCGTTTYSEHTVKTLETAKEWYPDIDSEKLPITVMQYSCVSCERIHVKNRRE